MKLLISLCFFAVLNLSNSFYVPGVAPSEFKAGDTVEIKVRRQDFYILSENTEFNFDLYNF